MSGSLQLSTLSAFDADLGFIVAGRIVRVPDAREKGRCPICGGLLDVAFGGIIGIGPKPSSENSLGNDPIKALEPRPELGGVGMHHHLADEVTKYLGHGDVKGEVIRPNVLLRLTAWVFNHLLRSVRGPRAGLKGDGAVAAGHPHHVSASPSDSDTSLERGL